MKKLLLLAIFMIAMVSNAQIKLTGVVKDSIGEPLEMANVLAIMEAPPFLLSLIYIWVKLNSTLT